MVKNNMYVGLKLMMKTAGQDTAIEKRKYLFGRLKWLKMKAEEKNAAGKLREKLKKMTVDNKFHSQDDVYIIEDGSCTLIKGAINENEAKLYGSIGRGSCFGVHSLFKMQSHDYFGDIIADAPETCLYRLSRAAMERIPFCEREAMLGPHATSMRSMQRFMARRL